MKKLFLAIYFFLLCAVAHSAENKSLSDAIQEAQQTIDYICVSDCVAKGYMYQYCVKVCSY